MKKKNQIDSNSFQIIFKTMYFIQIRKKNWFTLYIKHRYYKYEIQIKFDLMRIFLCKNFHNKFLIFEISNLF